MGAVHLERAENMAEHYSTQEIAEMLLQLIDGGGSVLVDDAEYIGQGVHKLYVERDTLVSYAHPLESRD